MVKPIELKDIEPFLPEAKKAGLTFNKSTNYYGCFKGDKIVGFTGIMFYKNKAVFKNHYVPKEHRGNGYFKEMFEYSLTKTKIKRIKIVEATCTNMSIKLYYAYGFNPVKKFKDFIKVRYENL